MVSLRRRRNLGLSSALPPVWFDDEAVGHFGPPPPGYVFSRPIILTDMEKNGDIDDQPTGIDSLSMPGSNSSQHQNDQTNDDGSKSPKQESDHPSPAQQVKPRTQDRKINVHEQELASVRGVYLKNSKWQAAIKVNKKQIHLGTLDTPEEAVRIYDRAAFVMGRAPNFELPEEDKEELRQLKWNEFLKKTKLETSCHRKRKQRDEAVSEDQSPQAKHSQNEANEAVVAELK